MAEKKEFWSEKRLKKGIYALVAGIIIVIIALAGWWFYLNNPYEPVPDVLATAITKAQKTIEKTPNSVNAHLNLAQLYLQAKEYDNVIGEAKTILKLDKKSDYAHTLMGMAYEGQEKTGEAVKQYEIVIKASEEITMPGFSIAYTEALYRLGKIYIAQKKYDKAIDYLKRSVNFNSADADAKYQLGLAYIGKGDYDSAIEQLSKASAFDPEFYQATYALGQAYEKKGNKEEAIKAYKRTLEQNPGFDDAQKALDRLQK